MVWDYKHSASAMVHINSGHDSPDWQNRIDAMVVVIQIIVASPSI
jgi:hypothetical protein